MPSFSTIGTANIKAFGLGGTRPPSGAPHSLQTSVPNSTQINLSWVIVDPTANTQIFRDNVLLDTVAEGVTSYIDTPLSSASTHQYVVRHSKYHIPLVSANSDFASDTTKLNAASSLSASIPALPAGSSQINLSWSANGETTGTTTRIYYAVGTSPYQEYTTTGIGATSCTVSGLLSTTTYNFKVQQIKNGVTSPNTEAVSATTGLLAPTAISGTAINSSAILVTWTNGDTSTPQVAAQLCYGDGTPVIPTTLTNSDQSATDSYTVTELDSATNYTFKVRHLKNGAFSAFSPTSSSIKTLFGAPSALTVVSTTSSTSASEIELRWTLADPTGTIELYRTPSGAGHGGASPVTVSGQTSYTDRNLSTATQYTYYIQQTKNGEIRTTASVSQRTPFNKPQNVQLSSPTSTSIVVGWQSGDVTANTQVYFVGNETLQAEVLPGVQSATISGLTSGTAYEFRVRHKKVTVALEERYTDFASSEDEIVTNIVPATFTSATVVSDSRVDLVWVNGDTSAGATIEVYRADTATGTGVRIVNTPATSNQTTHADTGVSAARDYWYYVKHVKGAQSVVSNRVSARPQAYFTGGTIVQHNGYRVHTFTDSASFVLPSIIGVPGTVEYLVAAGGGGGGSAYGGGGGGGGVIQSSAYIDTTRTIGIGGGGASDVSGSDSNINGVVTAAGGGRGGDFLNAGSPGGSGGGGGTAAYYPEVKSGGAASPSGQGNPGGAGTQAWDYVYVFGGEELCYYNDCGPCTYFHDGECEPAYGGPVRAAGGGGGARTGGRDGGGAQTIFGPYGPGYRTDGGYGGEGIANEWAPTGLRVIGSGGGGSISGGSGGARQGIGGSGAGNGGIGGSIPATNAVDPESSPHRSGGGGGGPSGGGGNHLGGSGSKGIVIIRYRYVP